MYNHYPSENVRKRSLLISLFICLSLFTFASEIIYVSPQGRGNKSGSSWSNSMSDLQAAVDKAAAEYPAPDVWVAQGTYVGDTADVSAFVMAEGVAVYGSLVGNESASYDLSKRDFQNHATVLDGQNGQRVLNQLAAYADTTMAVWNGFVLQNGKTTAEEGEDGNGGGASLKSYGRLVNCRIHNNEVVGYGAQGGGAYLEGGELVNCIVHNNSQLHYQGEGGGVFAERGAAIYNCTVVNNLTVGRGGGLYLYSWSGTVQVCNTIVWGNENEEMPEQINQGGEALISYCAIEEGFSGINNLTISSKNNGNQGGNYVRFIDPEQDDYRLDEESVSSKAITIACFCSSLFTLNMATASFNEYEKEIRSTK